MYTPPSFRIDDRATLFSLMDEFSFATLVTERSGSLFASHLPLLTKREGEEGRLVGHMARANEQWRGFDGHGEALAIFQGPHGYVSPAWYAVQPSVPTWNYIAVHAYGRPRVIDDYQSVVDILSETVVFYEAGRREPWAMDFPPGYLEKMARAIVVFEMKIDRIEGKAKLSQNRSEQDRLLVIEALEKSALPEERELANRMRDALLRAKDAVQ